MRCEPARTLRPGRLMNGTGPDVASGAVDRGNYTLVIEAHSAASIASPLVSTPHFCGSEGYFLRVNA